MVAERQEIPSLSHRQRHEFCYRELRKTSRQIQCIGQIWTVRCSTMSDTRHGSFIAAVLFRRVFLPWHEKCNAFHHRVGAMFDEHTRVAGFNGMLRAHTGVILTLPMF
ncbi:hypothetical protein DA102_035875 [Sinorhizobium meliloti]|nr:hypothetical protein DA102_035875 [Sinorhizobium meliloti]